MTEASRLRPDIVLLDVQLPDVDGFEVAESLAEAQHSPPVVLTSTREAADYGERIRSSSAVGFLPKTALSGSALKALLGRR
jgi:DNA-binding NarL/FixJ family response regulator